MRSQAIFLWLLLNSVILAGCSSPTRSPQMQATVNAISTAAVATVSARLLGEPGSTVSTIESEILQVSQEPESDLVGADPSGKGEAQATAFAPFLVELSSYQVDPNMGKSGWIHPPLTLEAQGPQGATFANQYANTVATDFVLAADITWRAGADTTGCGFLLRSDGNQSAPNQYVLGISRFGGGRVYFSVMAEGETVSQQEADPTTDSSFSTLDSATNRLAVVVRGYQFAVYINGVLIGEFDPNQPPSRPALPPPPPEPADSSNPLELSAYLAAKRKYDETTNQLLANYSAQLRAYEAADREFERGFTAMGALAQQGAITCTFDDAWLWHITE